jgi:phage FluMu gp28-like protein
MTALHEPRPAVLLPYQQRWIEDPARVKVFEKSRRIGASWATAAHCVLEASSGKQDCWYVSYNEDSAKEFILDAIKWCKWLNIAADSIGAVVLEADDDGDLCGVNAFRIVFPSGKRITALTSRARNLRGKQGLVVIDEAAFHDDLAVVMKAAFALLMWGGSVWIMSTHNGIDNEFARMCDEVRDGIRPYSLHRITIEDALQQGLYRRICLVHGWRWSPEAERVWLAELELEYRDGVREELYCEPAKSGQSYLGRALIESRMFDAPVVRIARPDTWALEPANKRERELAEWLDAVVAPLLRALPRSLPHGFGFDFGRYTDRSVMAPFTLEQGLCRRFPFLLEMLNLPHDSQWQVVRYVGDRLPYLFRGCLDAGGNGSWVAEQAWMHWGDQVIEQVNLTVKWYAENMPAFREAHESGLILYPRDLDVRNDLVLIRRIDGVPRLPHLGNESVVDRKRRHGDAAIALALGYAASRDAASESQRWGALTQLY